MAKVKIKCASCGKSFKSPDAKRTLCPECQAARKAASGKTATTATAVAPAQPAFDVRAAFVAAQQAAGDYAAYRSAPPPAEPPAPAASPDRAPDQERGAGAGAPAAAPARRVGPPAGREAGARARTGEATHTPKPRPAPAPRPPRQPKESTPPFVPSEEQVEAIRQRYLELAQPEYDGIRHQIAHDLAVPIRVVKDVVKELRAQMSLPSWWELAALTLTEEQRAAVRALYLPHLPLPDVGIHKSIADELGLKSLAVYSTIRTLREELGLPRYNDRPDRPAGDHPGAAPGAENGTYGETGADADPAGAARVDETAAYLPQVREPALGEDPDRSLSLA